MMTSVSLQEALAVSTADESAALSVLAPDARLAEVERNLDRTSDAFVDAMTLLDRCLSPRFFV